MVSNETMWKKWYEENQPEEVPMPDYEQRLKDQNDINPFLKLLLVRSLRVDRSILMCKEFIRNTKEMGPAFVDPVTASEIDSKVILMGHEIMKLL